MGNNKGYQLRGVKESANFMQRRLSDCGITLKEMAEKINTSYRYTVSYFSGFVLPNKDAIKRICDILEMPYEVGVEKFNDIHNEWGEAHKDTYYRFSNTYRPYKKGGYGDVAKPNTKPAAEIVKKHPRRKPVIGFWNHKISGKGISTKELASKLGKPYSTTTAYLSGFVMPDNEVIKFFCKEFNVDFDRAYSEFVKVHEAWGIEHADTYEKSGSSFKIKQITITDKPVEQLKEAVKSSTKSTRSPGFMECLRLMYGKISREDFDRALTLSTSKQEMMRFAYDMVDYDTFCAML